MLIHVEYAVIKLNWFVNSKIHGVKGDYHLVVCEEYFPRWLKKNIWGTLLFYWNWGRLSREWMNAWQIESTQYWLVERMNKYALICSDTLQMLALEPLHRCYVSMCPFLIFFFSWSSPAISMQYYVSPVGQSWQPWLVTWPTWMPLFSPTQLPCAEGGNIFELKLFRVESWYWLSHWLLWDHSLDL